MQTQDDVIACSACGRKPPFCVCEFVEAGTLKTQVLVLQHPQEPGMDIGTVAILARAFPQVTVKTGLSWANLKKIVGDEVEYSRWGVLYMGSVRVEDLPQDEVLIAVDRGGKPEKDGKRILGSLRGIVLLDGTWSQAKTLWWRNAWLLKLQRLVLNPQTRSRYDQIRKEPRKGCLSTLESALEALTILERREDLREQLTKPLDVLIERTKAHRPYKVKKKDYRRRSKRNFRKPTNGRSAR